MIGFSGQGKTFTEAVVFFSSIRLSEHIKKVKNAQDAARLLVLPHLFCF